MVELKVNALCQLHAITKCISLVLSIICLALFWEYGRFIILFESFPPYNITALNFAYCITPSTLFVLFYYLVMYVFGEKEPGKHPISNALFSFPFALFHFSLGVIILKSENIEFTANLIARVTKEGIIGSGVFYILTAVALFIDGVVAVIKRN